MRLVVINVFIGRVVVFMKVLLVGINAKFIHSNLAIRCIQKYAGRHNYSVEIEEYTINQQVDYILGEIYKKQPDILGLSCYIWNIEFVKKIVKAYKKISKDTFICLGGPEVSYHPTKFLEQQLSVDAIICGEGEDTFKRLLDSKRNNEDLRHVNGLVYRRNQELVINHNNKALEMDEIPFVYEEGLKGFENRILYYETMRGCPFNCQYCLSSIEKGVRFRSFKKIKNELQFFLDHKVMQVKFVDRTFNCRKEHAMNIWRYLHEHDNGITNFHFEISGDLLDEEVFDFLSTVREGLFQFEIGVQSTNTLTIQEIKRKTHFEKLSANIQELKQHNNIHLHLDLIAGLPKEDYQSFANSFNEVYRLEPEQLQLGFLKVLKGSGMEENAEDYGLKYRDYAPYEVLCTQDISYQELQQLKMLEEMVEIYYNSGNYYYTMRYLEKFFNTPFILYEKLAKHYEENGYHQYNHSKIGLCTVLKEFSETVDCEHFFVNDLIKLDLFLQEKLRKYPEWINRQEKYKQEIINFYKDESNIVKYLPELTSYTSKQIGRMAHIEIFKYDMMQYINSHYKNVEQKESALLFNYHNRDKMRHNAKIFAIDLG